MSTIVVMPGGFHPFHAGHAALYNSARRAFPGAEVFVAATNDTSNRPFPFAIKEKLAKLAGVEAGHFVQVKSPFRADEITAGFNPEQDVLIFVRSEKDAGSQPKPGGVKKDGSPAYLQPLEGVNKLEPFARHAYMAYLPTVEFGPGMKSATEIRTAWPQLNEKRKTALVMSLYPATQKNPALAANVVKMLDTAMGGELDEGWKDVVAGGAMALGALGAGAQTMPNINAQQVELANKYYNVLVQRAKEDGIKLDTRTLNVIKAKAQDAAAKKTQQSTQQQGFPAQGSERRVSRNIDNFESQYMQQGAGMTAGYQRRENQPVDENQGWAATLEGAGKKCPPATQDIGINLANRQKAIDEYGYGPLNPDLPNTKFWMKKVDEWNLDSMEEAQQSLCGNCAAFDVRQETLDCIAQGIDSDSPEDAEGVIDAGNLGYCKFLKFKCASRRTCDAWVTGGPLADKSIDEDQSKVATSEEKHQGNIDADPELKQARLYAKQHYPEFSRDEDLAYDKWVQRSIKHGLEDDKKQFTILQGIATKIQKLETQLKQAVAQRAAVDESDYIEEKWSKKYKSSINCANPKGFSQKAHCAGRKK